MTTLDENGAEVVIELVGMHYGNVIREEVESIDEAVSWAESWVDSNYAAPFAIVVGGDIVRYRNPPTYEWVQPTAENLAEAQELGV